MPDSSVGKKEIHLYTREIAFFFWTSFFVEKNLFPDRDTEGEAAMISEQIATVPLFKSLSRKDVSHLAQIAKLVDYPNNLVLFREGEKGDRLYIICEGKLDIIKDQGTPEEHLLRVCGPGEHVGEMSFFLPQGVRSATVKTRSAVRLLEIRKDDFEALLARRPSVSVAIATGIAQRMLDSESSLIRIIADKDGRSQNVLKSGEQTVASGHDLDHTKGNSHDLDRNPVRGVPRLQIKTFGNFGVLRGETSITERDWKAKQPKLLLKAIIVRGGSSIPKDVLIEDLWPEISTASGLANFKVLLHRLRKALEPNMDKALGSSYLILKENLISLNKEFCRIDLDEFLTLRQKGRKFEEAEDFKMAVSCFTSAIELYTGDFLAEDLYVPWAEQKRNELRVIYMDILSRAADLCQSQGSSKKAIDFYKLMIKADAACEEAYQKLMSIYFSRGMRAEAVKMYEECRNALQTTLGVKPSNLTNSIYRRISEQP